ncbi:MAG: DUF4010 domain-containing protein [Anaeromyxobacteraceae bacterium]
MLPLEPFAALGLALAAGFLIGLERERSRDPSDATSFVGGARTHPLLALAGALASLGARQHGPVMVAIPFLALVLWLGTNYAGDVWRDRHRGITSEVAFLVTFSLGVVAAAEDVLQPLSARVFVVAGAAVVAAAILSAKPALHPLVGRISSADLAAAMRFLIVAVVLLPLLPDRTFGPLDVLNPFKIGALLVLISALSFAGYAAVRLLGPERGLGLTGFVGGLVSSTAVTLSMAGRARETPALAGPASVAVVLASTVMFARVIVLVAIANPALLGAVAPPLAAAACAAALAALLLWLRARGGQVPGGPRDGAAHGGALAVANPFELGSALRFALLFGLVLLVSKGAATYLGAGGTYAAGLLAGATDVDAITLSMADLARTSVGERVAAVTILLGVASNTLVKAVMAAVAGGWPFGRRVAAAQGAALAAGALALALG